MTTAQFEQYQVIIIGDPGQANGAVGAGSVAMQTESTWEPAVQNSGGNKFVFVADPVSAYRYTLPTPNSPAVIADGIAYAGAVSGATGVYLDLANSYQTENWNSPLPIMAGLSSYPSSDWNFASSDAVGGDENTVNLIGTTPQTTDLSDTLLDNWWPSWNGVFQTYPPDYKPLAIVPNAGKSSGYAQTCGTDVSTGASACGLPYILVSGQNITQSGPSAAEQGGPTPIGESPTTCPKGRPVNCATGVFWHTFQDARVPGNGVPLDFTRTYSSLDAPVEGPLGYGWTDSYDMTLNLSPGQASVTEANGTEVPFIPNGSGFTAPPRVLASLVQNGDGSYTYMRYIDHIQYVFNATGQLIKEIDRNGYTTSLTYTSGQLTSVTDPSGRTLTISYNGSLISSMSEPGGNTWTYSYDANGNLTSVVGPGSRTWSYTYDSNHLLLTMEEPTGGTTTNTYNSTDQVTKQVDPAGDTTTWSYSGDPGSTTGSTTTITDGAGNVTAESYQNMELQSMTRGYGTVQAATTSYQYDPTLRISQVTDPNNNVTKYTYDSHGNLLTVTDPMSRVTTYANYNSFDEPTQVTDPRGTMTTYTYDSDGNLLSKSTPDIQTNQTQTWGYAYTDSSNPGDVTQVTDPDGNITKLAYDSHGDLTSVTDALGNETTYGYDSLGERTSMVMPAGNVSGGNPSQYTTTYSYDVPFELTSATDPLNHTTSYGHNGDGALTSVTDPKNNKTSYALNGDNQVTQVTKADNSTTKTSYNGDGTIHNQTDGNGNVTTYGYDPLGRLTSRTDALSNATAYGYDNNGNVTSVKDAAGRTTSYGYNADNEPTSITYSDGTTPNVTYGYNADGERTSMSDGTGSSSYTYDSLGRLTGSTRGNGTTVGYSYDLASNETSITYPNGKVVSRAFNSDEQLKSVTDWLNNKTSFSYDANSNLTGESYPNNLLATSTFNAADQLTGITDGEGQYTIGSFGYSRDAVGQVTGETDTGLGQSSTTYGYNSLNQLTSAGNSSYGYDAAGNPTNLAGSTGNYNQGNQLLSLTAAGGTTNTFTYDKLGERTGAAGSMAGQLAYNQAGELTQATTQVPANAPTSGYDLYDAKGNVWNTPGASWYGSTANNGISDVAGMAASVDGKGYWIAEANGTVHHYGDAKSEPAISPAHPVIGILASPTGGYYLYTAYGNVYNTSDAAWYGSPATTGVSNVVGMGIPRDGKGYWVVTATGTVYNYGDAPSIAKINPANPLIGVAADPAGGFLAYSAHGNIYNEWVANWYGSPASTGVSNITGMDTTPDGAGYWVTDTAGNVYNYGDAQPLSTFYPASSVIGVLAGRRTITASTNTTKFTYDGTGLRSTETTPDQGLYKFAYDLTGSLPQPLSDGANSYIYGPSGQPIEQISPGGTPTYLSDDQLGSTRLLTNTGGSVMASYSYDAYGNPTYHNPNPGGGPGKPTVTTPLQYAGQYTDTYTALQYDTARYYDPQTAQFLTQDPLIDLTGQPYSYANDNPINETDPLGLCGGFLDLGCVGDAIGSGATWVYNNPVETVGLVAGGVSLATGVGEVVAGGAAVTEGVLGSISVGSGFVAAGVDTHYCLAGSGISCVGAGVGLLAAGGGAAVAFGVARDTAASGATAIGLTFGGIGLLGDLAGAAKGATFGDLCSYGQNGPYSQNGL